MSQRPWDYYNVTQPGTETISHESKQKLIALRYENWLRVQQSQGNYNTPISHYHPSTVKEFLIDYRVSEQEKWNESKPRGYSAVDGNNLAKFHILSAFVNYSDENIRALIHETNQTRIYPQNKTLESFISDVHKNRLKDFGYVNKDTSHQVSLPLRASYWALSSIFSVLSSPFKGKQKNRPLREVPRASQDAQSFKRTQSMPINYKSPSHGVQSFRDDSKKRKGSDQQDSGSAQGHPKRTKSAGGSSYFDAFRSGNKNEIEKADRLRFEKHKQEEERREAERKEREEAKQKGKKPQQPQHTSSFPSTSASQIHNPLIDPRTGRLKTASTIQGSALSRPKPQQPRRNGGVPGSNPRKPLSATPTISRATVTSATVPRRY